MKPWFLLIILTFCTPLIGVRAAQGAQVSINPAALAQLAGISAAAPFVPALPARPRTPATAHRVQHKTALTETAHQAPAITAAARPAPPALVMPPAAAPVPPPLSLAFAPGSTALPASAALVLKPFCRAAGTIGIDARAPPDADGVSGAMRLSLARALAVRDALVACGVARSSLLPRALGSIPGVDDNVTMISSGPQK